MRHKHKKIRKNIDVVLGCILLGCAIYSTYLVAQMWQDSHPTDFITEQQLTKKVKSHAIIGDTIKVRVGDKFYNDEKDPIGFKPENAPDSNIVIHTDTPYLHKGDYVKLKIYQIDVVDNLDGRNIYILKGHTIVSKKK